MLELAYYFRKAPRAPAILTSPFDERIVMSSTYGFMPYALGRNLRLNQGIFGTGKQIFCFKILPCHCAPAADVVIFIMRFQARNL